MPTYARLPIGARLETVVAPTLVTALQIHAATIPTESRINSTLIDVLTLIYHPDLLVPGRADAHEGPNEVLALVLAVIRWRSTFIHICNNNQNHLITVKYIDNVDNRMLANAICRKPGNPPMQCRPSGARV